MMLKARQWYGTFGLGLLLILLGLGGMTLGYADGYICELKRTDGCVDQNQNCGLTGGVCERCIAKEVWECDPAPSGGCIFGPMPCGPKEVAPCLPLPGGGYVCSSNWQTDGECDLYWTCN